eukprot:2315340-Pyramimonas_sp.AAC.1
MQRRPVRYCWAILIIKRSLRCCVFLFGQQAQFSMRRKQTGLIKGRSALDHIMLIESAFFWACSVSRSLSSWLLVA